MRESLAEAIESRVERLKTADPWESAVLAHEIAEKAALLGSMDESDQPTPASDDAEEISVTPPRVAVR